MESSNNVAVLIEQMRMGYCVPRQLSIIYCKLKNLSRETFYFDEGSTCPIFTSRFCHIKGNEHILAAANEDGKIILQNMNNLQCNSVQAHNNAIFDLIWMNHDMKLISGSGDHSSILWQLAEGDIRSVFQFHGHDHSVKTISCRPNDSCVFATGARDGILMTWDTRMNVIGTSIKPDKIIDCTRLGHNKGKRQYSQPHSITGVVYQDENTLISCSAGEGSVCT